MKLWQKGLIILVAGLGMNAIFMNLGVGGLLRELSRLTVLIGIVIALIGAFKKSK